MKRRSVYLLIATILAVLVPSPGRFVYGVTLVLELNILMLIGTLTVSLVKQMKLEEITSLIVLVIIIASTILFRQIMIMFQPEIMLTLGFIIYLMPVSFFIIGFFSFCSEIFLATAPLLSLEQIIRFTKKY